MFLIPNKHLFQLKGTFYMNPIFTKKDKHTMFHHQKNKLELFKKLESSGNRIKKFKVKLYSLKLRCRLLTNL